MKALDKKKILKILNIILIVILYIGIDSYIIYSFWGEDLFKIVEIPNLGTDHYYKFPFWFVLGTSLISLPLLMYSIIVIIPQDIYKTIKKLSKRKR